MAEVGLKTQDSFSCPICLDPLENPVTIPCGHNYCMVCIEDYWNGDKHSESYSCPECRETFTPRPALNKNSMFAEVVEQLKKARLQDASPRNSGPASTECSMCAGQKKKAVRFCPESSCEAHTLRHEKANLGENHFVVVINKEPRMDVCLRHNTPLEIYCRTDRQLICSLCFAESHRDHDAISVAPVSTERREPKSSHVDTRHGNRHTSHTHRRRTHQTSRHGSGHGSKHRSSSRQTLPLKSSHEASHQASHEKTHGSNMIRHGQVVGGGHMKSKHRSSHGSWHLSSRHERSQR